MPPPAQASSYVSESTDDIIKTNDDLIFKGLDDIIDVSERRSCSFQGISECYDVRLLDNPKKRRRTHHLSLPHVHVSSPVNDSVHPTVNPRKRRRTESTDRATPAPLSPFLLSDTASPSCWDLPENPAPFLPPFCWDLPKNKVLRILTSVSLQHENAPLLEGLVQDEKNARHFTGMIVQVFNEVLSKLANLNKFRDDQLLLSLNMKKYLEQPGLKKKAYRNKIIKAFKKEHGDKMVSFNLGCISKYIQPAEYGKALNNEASQAFVVEQLKKEGHYSSTLVYPGVEAAELARYD